MQIFYFYYYFFNMGSRQKSYFEVISGHWEKTFFSSKKKGKKSGL